MNILILVAAAIVFRIAFDVFISRAGGKINDLLANGIFSTLAGVLPLVIYLATKSKNNTPTTKAGVMYSVLAGFAVLAFSLVLIRIFARGGNLSFVIPAIYGGALVGASLAGWLIFKEPANAMSVVAVVVIASGTALLVAARA